MKFEIKNNKIYRKGEEIKPDTSGTNEKVVSGMSAHGLWFSASTSTEKITIYKKDIIKAQQFITTTLFILPTSLTQPFFDELCEIYPTFLQTAV